MYTLVVVDMQAKFDASLEHKVQEHCKRAIAKAVKNKAAIVFVEFAHYGPTLPNLTKVTRGYDKVYHATKRDWDGSSQVLELVKKHNLFANKFRVCGVYTECCVQATVEGLHQETKHAKIQLIESACNSSDGHYQRKGLNAMRKLNRVRLVKE